MERAPQVAASGTGPLAGPSTTTDDRYLQMIDDFGLVARQQLTCGTRSIGIRVTE